jgi:dihydropteroate synthase
VLTNLSKCANKSKLFCLHTTLSAVADAALDTGATLINDISAGLQDKRIFSVAAQRDVPIILMHIKGQPKTMQQEPYYEDVVSEVLTHLQARIEQALAADNIYALLYHLSRLFYRAGCIGIMTTIRKTIRGDIKNAHN